MRRFALFALFLFLTPAFAHAAPRLLWSDVASTTIITEGSNISVPFGVSKNIKAEYTQNKAGIGLLYFVPTDSPRELITAIGGTGGTSTLAWAREGTYELDAYNPTIIIEAHSHWQRLVAFIIGERVHAQSIGKYVGTIHFAIRNSSPKTTPPPSVLFIPGMKGSRLYEETGGVISRRWEPGLFEADIPALFLDSLGHSINTIFTNATGTIARTDVTLFNFDVYRTFFEKLDSLKNAGALSDWVSSPYDWRQNPEDIANNGTAYPNGIHSLKTEVEQLAKDGSKVIIVGHSNGGLVAKALVSKLAAEGKAGLVSKVILVATPQLGTPDALAAMLHGEGQSIPSWGGFIVSASDARSLAEYMPSAYTLLPSSAYFSKVSDPVLDLTEAPTLRTKAGIYSSTINSATELENFLSGNGGRTKPPPSNTGVPNVLSTMLLANASSTHDRLDTWVPPAGIEVIQIVGWGVETPKAVVYKEKQYNLCSFASCAFETFLTYDTPPTEDGDGTVVSPSAAIDSLISTYYLNIHQYNFDGKRNNKHRDITEIPDLQILFQKLIASSSPSSLPTYVSTSLPTSTSQHLRLAVHSPVSIDIYDTLGRHTGLATNQSAGNHFLLIDEQIPNSYYWQYGHDKYIGLPTGEPVTVTLRGLDTGTFTLEESRYVGDTVQNTTAYTGIPVTASTTATLTLNGDPTNAPLVIDINGDGVTDFTIASSTQSTNPLSYVRLIKTTISTLPIGTAIKHQLTAKFANVEHLLLKDTKWDDLDNDNDAKTIKKNARIETQVLRKLEKIENYLEKQLTQSQKKKNPPLTNVQVSTILDMITQLETLAK